MKFLNILKKFIMSKKQKSVEEIYTEQLELMLKCLLNSSNEDIKGIAEYYFSADLEKRKKIIKHYKTNGSMFINAVFNIDSDNIEKYAHIKDLDLLGC